jgi:hypothetical protein
MPNVPANVLAHQESRCLVVSVLGESSRGTNCRFEPAHAGGEVYM